MGIKNHHNITTLSALERVAGELLACLKTGDVVYLHGDLGVGKTTFCQYLLRLAGVVERIKSPTYALYAHYEVANQSFIHMDLYRLSDPEELYYLDIEWVLNGSHIVLIEWPQKGLGVLPEPNWQLSFQMKGEARTLIIT